MNILSHAHAGAALMAGAVRSRRPNARLSRPAPEAGDTRLVRELTAAGYDGVLIGGFISGRDREDPPAERRALWFSRVLNSVLVRELAAKIILVRHPADALPAVGRVLGDGAPGP